MSTPDLAIIGTGRLGEAILRALLESGSWSPEAIVCTTRRAEHADELASTYGVATTTDNRAAVADVSIVVLALKPQILLDVLDELGGAITAPLVVSVAAGIGTDAIESRVASAAVVRAMPNTPLLVGTGMTALAAGSRASADDVAAAAALFSAAGRTVTVDESAMDAVTAVSGSGPAYVFRLAAAMLAGAVAEGLDEATARALVTQTLVGAATMLDVYGEPAALAAQVTSPGGTTAAALDAFDAQGFDAIVADAIAAARRRSRELGA
ncbi:MAG: pyrroline-5-carboxylate reductase [Nitriliruptoraceae bacterium]